MLSTNSPHPIPTTKGSPLKQSSETFEGTWDCSDCEETGIAGSETNCPNCKNPQDSVTTPSEQWYLPENAPVVSDPEKLAKFNAGPAWNCGRCQTLNYGSSAACSACKHPLDFDDTVNRTITYDNSASQIDTRPDPRDEIVESDLDKAVRTIEGEASTPRRLFGLVLRGEPPTIGSNTKFYEEVKEKSQRDYNERQRLSKYPQFLQDLYLIWQVLLKPHSKKLLIAASVLLLAMLSVIVVNVFQYYTATIDGTVTVSERHWQRSIEVEQFTTLTGSNWTYPSDARITSTDWRIQSYREVIDGYRTEQYTDHETKYRSGTEQYTCGSKTIDNGNGSFRVETKTCTRSVDVPYQEKVQKERRVPITHHEPIYATWYNYTYDRWTTDRWESESDTTSPQQVIWPEVTDLRQVNRSGSRVGDERVGDERRESYTVVYNDTNDKQHSDNINEGVWQRVEVGDTVSARYYQRNGELSSVDWDSVPA